eukprot:2004396-Rhodomonas_salina.1
MPALGTERPNLARMRGMRASKRMRRRKAASSAATQEMTVAPSSRWSPFCHRDRDGAKRPGMEE